jgi:hypothetical protein
MANYLRTEKKLAVLGALVEMADRVLAGQGLADMRPPVVT